jgi:hypothetical protein
LHAIQWTVLSSIGILHFTHIFLLLSNKFIKELSFLNDFFFRYISLEKNINFKIIYKSISSKNDIAHAIIYAFSKKLYPKVLSENKSEILVILDLKLPTL